MRTDADMQVLMCATARQTACQVAIECLYLTSLSTDHMTAIIRHADHTMTSSIVCWLQSVLEALSSGTGATAGELGGRTTGSVAWREARGELGA